MPVPLVQRRCLISWRDGLACAGLSLLIHGGAIVLWPGLSVPQNGEVPAVDWVELDPLEEKTLLQAVTSLPKPLPPDPKAIASAPKELTAAPPKPLAPTPSQPQDVPKKQGQSLPDRPKASGNSFSPETRDSTQPDTTPPEGTTLPSPETLGTEGNSGLPDSASTNDVALDRSVLQIPETNGMDAIVAEDAVQLPTPQVPQPQALAPEQDLSGLPTAIVPLEAEPLRFRVQVNLDPRQAPTTSSPSSNTPTPGSPVHSSLLWAANPLAHRCTVPNPDALQGAGTILQVQVMIDNQGQAIPETIAFAPNLAPPAYQDWVQCALVLWEFYPPAPGATTTESPVHLLVQIEPLL